MGERERGRKKDRVGGRWEREKERERVSILVLGDFHREEHEK